MWVIGGSDSAAQKTVEFVDSNEKNSIMLEEQLPFEVQFHCTTQINSTHGIITGGTWYSKKTLIVNLNDFDMMTGPTLRKSRAYHSCTRISAANGTDYVIVVGGIYNRDTSEVLVGNSWKDGILSSILMFRITEYSILGTLCLSNYHILYRTSITL